MGSDRRKRPGIYREERESFKWKDHGETVELEWRKGDEEETFRWRKGDDSPASQMWPAVEKFRAAAATHLDEVGEDERGFLARLAAHVERLPVPPIAPSPPFTRREREEHGLSLFAGLRSVEAERGQYEADKKQFEERLRELYGEERWKDARRDIRDARDIHRQLESALKSGDATAAAVLGVELGGLLERIEVRRFDRAAAAGRPTLLGAREGGESRRGKTKADPEKVRTAWREERKSYPHRRGWDMHVTRIIAKRFKLSESTVRRYLEKKK